MAQNKVTTKAEKEKEAVLEKHPTYVPPMFEGKKDVQRRTGRRKTSRARVWLSLGKGELLINGQADFAYFSDLPFAKKRVEELFALVGRERTEFNVSAKLAGGGKSSQLDALLHGIARSLEQYDNTMRPVLKRAGFLKRDARMKERRKYGLAKARKAKQFSKR